MHHERERERERERALNVNTDRYVVYYAEGISRKRTTGINKCLKWDLEVLLRHKMWPRARPFWQNKSSLSTQLPSEFNCN